ncbi:MAG TPA: pyrimidine dimer DNA glycosylase/endonuclease V [Nitrospiria bacterium]|jgi:hypothetical protein
MRIWDIPPISLCRQHLLGEHRELHAIWSILINGKKGYRNHPETLRWVGALNGLYQRQRFLVKEFERRGYRHHSPLDKEKAGGKIKPQFTIDTPARQKKLLQKKGVLVRFKFWKDLFTRNGFPFSGLIPLFLFILRLN